MCSENRGANIVFIFFQKVFSGKKRVFKKTANSLLLFLSQRIAILHLSDIINMVKVQFEYLIKCSPKVLFNRLSTASGLAEWFADDVHVRGKQYTFVWEGSEQVAEMTLRKQNRLVRFNWVDDPGSYFEFKISQVELTGDVALIVADHCEEDETEGTEELWNAQVADLKHILGS